MQQPHVSPDFGGRFSKITVLVERLHIRRLSLVVGRWTQSEVAGSIPDVEPEVGDADATTVGDADAMAVGDADATTVGDVDATTVGDADATAVGDADAMAVGDADATTVGNADGLLTGPFLSLGFPILDGLGDLLTGDEGREGPDATGVGLATGEGTSRFFLPFRTFLSLGEETAVFACIPAAAN